jgi:hypothetical protein
VTAELRAPAEVVADVAEQLIRYIERYEERRDSRCVFAFLYLQLTRTLATSLGVGDPAFHNPAFVADLADCLAQEYFTTSDTMDSWLESSGTMPTAHLTPSDIPDAVPEPWREVFAALSGGRSYVLEDALFSMMAHISYDLPVALRGMASQGDVVAHLSDFHLMNEVLGNAVDFVQDELSNRYGWWLGGLDRIFARNDELLSNYGIRVSRGMAWYNFCRLVDPDARAEAEQSIRSSTGAFIRQVREPDNWLLRPALHLARAVLPERRRWPAPEPRP